MRPLLWGDLDGYGSIRVYLDAHRLAFLALHAQHDPPFFDNEGVADGHIEE